MDDLEMYAAASSLFTAREKEILARFRSVKRKREWVTGRIAAKEAYLNYTGSLCEIVVGESGEPLIVSSDNTPLFLSISHSGGIAVAIVSAVEIGFDLEEVEPRPDAFLNYFYSASEKNFLQQFEQGYHEEVTSLWTAKEAVSKVLGKGGQLNFKTIETHGGNAVLEGAPTDINLYRHVEKEFCFSLAHKHSNNEVN